MSGGDESGVKREGGDETISRLRPLSPQDKPLPRGRRGDEVLRLEGRGHGHAQRERLVRRRELAAREVRQELQAPHDVPLGKRLPRHLRVL